ncbi:MAG: glutathione S-transferase N-terminal domain-containing protein [Bacteriovoracaceae bacterium]|nr:glutathione S-transferase N-terminal domain-containing protein [Bacteriovoracaceae bacterium]
MSEPQLEFYYFDGCPFCNRVESIIEELKIQVDYKHIFEDPQNMEKLIADTGRKTVPVLYVDGKPMHESSDIINWLKKNVDNLQKR